MPIDFNRVPPRVKVPAAPRVSALVWTILLVLVMGAGAGLTIALWPTDRSANTPWFWFCVAGYPFLAWAFLLFAWLGYGYACRNQAIATNRVSDDAEQACHAMAARPLTIAGHAWCVSTDDSENSLQQILTGVEGTKSRPSDAVADREVNARWLNLPDIRFYPGNEISEYVRHRSVCTWLLERLIDGLLPQLRALPRGTRLYVELSHQSWLEHEVVETQILNLLAEQAPALNVEMGSSEPALTVFRADAWHDDRDAGSAYLLVAVELRNAISSVLSDGVAEAGVALLIRRSRPESSPMSAGLLLHRPAKGSLDSPAATLELAARWGQAPSDRLRTVWTHGLVGDGIGSVRQAAPLPDDACWIALETAVGDCSGAGPWLAVALAAEAARTTGDPQLVLCGEDEELFALVCRKRT
ncbi:hypothetical protein [Burkholderia anthina]|uniref:hypothetical protein n=1 Tax=Burkholderia anthina TaxID=179879 RepID=UPI0009BDAC56|nr:hypothetical protein [Burkholderia anthina]